MFSSTIGAYVCFGVVFNYRIFWFVAGSTDKDASLSVTAVDCHVSKVLTIEALGRLGVSLKELAVVGLVAPVNLLTNHFIPVFWLKLGEDQLICCLREFFLKYGFKDSYASFL